MKILLILLALCVPTMAQKIEDGTQTYLIDKGRALQIYRGSELGATDLELFKEGNDTVGKIAIVLKSKDRESLLDGFEMAGVAPGRKVVKERCFDSKGEECQRTPRRMP